MGAWDWISIGLLWALLGAAFLCFRVSAWHSREADYWTEVAWKVRLDPKKDDHYRQILNWAQAERPSKWRRLHGWQSPAIRMLDADR